MAGATGLQAALELARGRSEALGDVDFNPTAAWRSFRACWVALPAFLALRLMAWGESGLPDHPAHALAIDLLTYLIGWVGFALLSREAAAALGRSAGWPLFVIVWNWCNVVQYGLLLAASLPPFLGAPVWLSQAAWIVAVCWAVWLEWLAARLTLRVSGIAAAAFVALDLAVGLTLGAISG